MARLDGAPRGAMRGTRLSDWRTRIDAAAMRLETHVRRTPVSKVTPSQRPDAIYCAGARIFLKLEQTQRAGSFKARGAFNQLLSMAKRPERVVAASGGNHGAAVACAAQALGIEAEIFAPEISSPAKQALIREFGARLHLVGRDYAAAAAAAADRAQTLRAPQIHAYDHADAIAGQGTLARELESQIYNIEHEPLDTVLVAVGGGGLAAGVAAWNVGRSRVVGVESEGCPCLNAALEAGEPVDASVGGLAADALGAQRIGERPFDILNATLEKSVLVSDEAIREAQLMLWRFFRLAVEPAGATTLAALLSGAYRPEPGERLALLLCGGNVDLSTLAGLDG